MKKVHFMSMCIKERENELDPYGFVVKKIKTRDGRSTYILEEIQRSK